MVCSGERKQARQSCHALCEAQEEHGCGIGLRSCKDTCTAMTDNMDSRCVPLARDFYDCAVENDEVCGMVEVCADKGIEYTECLLGD